MKAEVVIIDVWVVHETIDDRGHLGGLVGVTSSKQDANIIAKDQGWYGGPGNIRKQKAISVGVDNGGSYKERVWLLDGKEPIDLDGKLKAKKEEIRKKALEKLDPEERAALGITD
ncbi:MAG TPA: hypothetical protein DHN29_21100 [Cytophagales bacterium]|nr:hypothetical protein [Cytophagales bacterium]|tara:strand:- start:102 stop:446 length:345 start_codon:yes stop_codon:yes gene_type:complete